MEELRTGSCLAPILIVRYWRYLGVVHPELACFVEELVEDIMELVGVTDRFTLHMRQLVKCNVYEHVFC